MEKSVKEIVAEIKEKEVTFTLSPQDLAIWDKNMKFQVEPGTFKVMIGASSKDIKLEGKFTINKQVLIQK